ncbi:MAG: hypothetical protein KKG09_03255 [Verrucomicrobia bacterium]|nr:hypothetical protein [Verrucomicrobiota bacterium]MCG2678799.1 hypothetical protein [Kiritimatiellia bacterium]MBU4246997.1 hypothetical protein [Verrucomicrobiota bacterium]MBU4291870.1 hypothetical protein [Verrucomicrobiota bacterium]MBU4427835.1 hypothetical protein [Verrucomicrobiota bacterium]
MLKALNEAERARCISTAPKLLPQSVAAKTDFSQAAFACAKFGLEHTETLPLNQREKIIHGVRPLRLIRPVHGKPSFTASAMARRRYPS